MMMNGRRQSSIERVGIVGVGGVGSTIAYAMIQSGAAKEVLLADLDLRRAEGEMMDLLHCQPFSKPVALGVVETSGLANCDLIIVTAGVAQSSGESRLDLVHRNTAIFKTFFPKLVEKNPDSFFLIVTNPVDVMTRVALRLTGLPPNQLFGSGTVLDTARFRTLISRHFNVQARHVHAYVIGEHGDSEVPVWSRATIGSCSIGEYCELHHVPLYPQDKEAINDEVRGAAQKIIERKGSTHFSIGLAAVRLTEALSFSQNSVYTVSRRCDDAYGIGPTCLSLPALINDQGAHASFALELAAAEHGALLKSAAVLNEVYEHLDLGD